MRLKKILTLVMVAAMAMTTVACGNNNNATTQADAGTTAETGTTAAGTDTTADGITGTVTITGSTSVEKILNEMKSEFEALNPGVVINYVGSGSSAGIKDTIAKTNNIGAASRELSDEEKATEGMTETKFAIDGIAVAVNPANEVEDLTIEQLRDIYSGKITNWKEVGGKDGEIYVISREESSGTRSGFEELIGLSKENDAVLTDKAAVSEGNGPVQLAVAGNENAIGYVSFAYIDDTVKGLKIEGVEATVDNVNNSTYLLSRPFLFVSLDDAAVTPAGKAFLEFALSEDGQACVEKHNAIRVD